MFQSSNIVLVYMFLAIITRPLTHPLSSTPQPLTTPFFFFTLLVNIQCFFFRFLIGLPQSQDADFFQI